MLFLNRFFTDCHQCLCNNPLTVFSAVFHCVVVVTSWLIKYHVWLTGCATWCCVVIQFTRTQGTGLRSPGGTGLESLTMPGWCSSVATRALLTLPGSTEHFSLGRSPVASAHAQSLVQKEIMCSLVNQALHMM